MTMAADEVATLEPERAWRPFSEESLWHVCPGHEWERFEWHRAGATAAPVVELITRCAVCGAPRCDSYRKPDDVTPQLWNEMQDHDQQLYRCTEERHHSGDHDFLIGGDE